MTREEAREVFENDDTQGEMLSDEATYLHQEYDKRGRPKGDPWPGAGGGSGGPPPDYLVIGNADDGDRRWKRVFSMRIHPLVVLAAAVAGIALCKMT